MKDFYDAWFRCQQYHQQYGVTLEWSLSGFTVTLNGSYGADHITKTLHISDLVNVDVKREMIRYEEIVMKGLSN